MFTKSNSKENVNKQPSSSKVTLTMRLGSTQLADVSMQALPFKSNGNIFTLRAQQNYHHLTLKANFWNAGLFSRF